VCPRGLDTFEEVHITGATEHKSGAFQSDLDEGERVQRVPRRSGITELLGVLDEAEVLYESGGGETGVAPGVGVRRSIHLLRLSTAAAIAMGGATRDGTVRYHVGAELRARLPGADAALLQEMQEVLWKDTHEPPSSDHRKHAERDPPLDRAA